MNEHATDALKYLDRAVTAIRLAQQTAATKSRNLAELAFRDLLRWVDAGGFAPAGVDVDYLRITLMELTPCRKVFIPPPTRT